VKSIGQNSHRRAKGYEWTPGAHTGPMPPIRKTTKRTAELLDFYYSDFPTDFEHFVEISRGRLRGARRVLDLGAGTGTIDSLDWRAPDRRVIGIDPDPRIDGHPFLDDRVRGSGFNLPFRDESLDAVVSVNVMEHIKKPESILGEVHRVLKKGGVFLVKTPNRRHYVARFANLTPTWFHNWYNGLRGRSSEDTFETIYRFNRFEEIDTLAAEAGFEVLSLDAFEGIPEYLLLSTFLFYPGLWFERWVNSKPSRNKWRANLEAVLRKPE